MLSSSLRVFGYVQLPKVAGISPLNLLNERSMVLAKVSNVDISDGMGPVRLFIKEGYQYILFYFFNTFFL